MKNTIEKEYRPCVAIFIINKKNKIFVGKRINSENSWQIPQGGIEKKNESIESAMFRELFEETGIKKEKIEIIACYPYEIQYDIPENHIPASWEKKFCGQKITCFFVKFIGSDDDINISISENPEFSEFKWINPEDLTKNAIYFKKNMYEKIVSYFFSEINYVLHDNFLNIK